MCRGLLVFVTLAAAGCAATPTSPAPAVKAHGSATTTTAPASGYPGTPAVPYRHHFDMSQDVQWIQECSYRSPTPTVRDEISYVGPPPNPSAVALITVVALRAVRWNTSDGARPTQAQADAMADQPGLFTPLDIDVTHVYAGSTLPEHLTTYAEEGSIGADHVSTCGFPLSSELRAQVDDSVVSPGLQYVAVFGDELLGGRNTPPSALVVTDLFPVHGSVVTDLAGPEPLPSN